MHDTFDDKSGSDISDYTDISEDEDDDFMDCGTDFDNESDIVVPLMPFFCASPSTHASSPTARKWRSPRYLPTTGDGIK